MLSTLIDMIAVWLGEANSQVIDVVTGKMAAIEPIEQLEL